MRVQSIASTFLVCVLVLLFTPYSCNSADSPEPIRIAAIFSLSGKAMNSNRPAIYGAEIAVQEINNGGGLLGRPVELVLFDNKSTPIDSYLAAQEAARAGVVGIIGAIWSSHSLAIAKVAQAHAIPMISPNSTIPSLTRMGNYIFRVCFNDDFQGNVLARFGAKELHAKTAIIFIDITSDFSMALSKTFSRVFTALGGKVVVEIEYKTGQEEYGQQIREALAHKADLIFFSGHDESGYLAAKLQKSGSQAIPLGNDGWDTDSFYSAGGSKILRGYYLTHWFLNPEDPPTQALIAKYGATQKITTPMVLTYDATHLLATAIRDAGTTDSAQVTERLQATRNFPGITGRISFDEQGNAIKKGCIVEIVNGIPHVLKWYDHTGN